ncbi:hypothetical protein JRO89_XS08G0155500 [Xanthoceras sorbifolium]|uniref:AP complex subunit sigma n=1 Tax=Xanthoceras sorbifolium TaxID=99658 RepID=A0ABQ8HPY3_9ROSI|nr:hypothetical protein JRO89_XS08G0155500 [Xanthoceras sorbifolium]
MIRSVMVMNTQGKPRLSKFYDYQVSLSSSSSSFFPVEKQQELIRSVFGVLSSRAENVSNFVEADSIFGPDTRLVYKHYATLYFVFVFDSSENELAMLDLIQGKFLNCDNFVIFFVETLDKCFKNVCELDIVFNYSKLHTILDEIIFGGQVLETSSTEVIKAVEEISKCSLSLSICLSFLFLMCLLESASNAIALVSKSVSSWRSR